jgi:RNA polymerase sigma-70 factor (ECF subfamily)
MSEYMSSAIGRFGDSSASAEASQENSWVRESRQGNAQAFNRLVLRWEKSIYNLAFRMLKRREEAEEATQEVFLLAFRGIRRFRQNSAFATWLYRIALNHCCTRLKQRPSGINLSLDDAGAALHPMEKLVVGETQPDALLRAEQRRRVLEALAYLPPEQQAVVELKFFQERTFEEVAEVLRIPLSTVKSRLYAGLTTLKSRLGNRY